MKCARIVGYCVLVLLTFLVVRDVVAIGTSALGLPGPLVYLIATATGTITAYIVIVSVEERRIRRMEAARKRSRKARGSSSPRS